MVRFLRVVAQILVLVIVALASALVSMRFAIHGREVKVPEIRGLTPADADRVAFQNGLELARSDRFYSATVPAGRIVSQQPEPGTRVRRGWRVQAAESLGPQMMEIPNVLGMSPRAAEINLRRRGLEMGQPSELPTDVAAPQTILAQTPQPGAQGVASPRVSLLYAAEPMEKAYVMPDLTGLPLTEATARAAGVGLKVINGAASSSASGAVGSSTGGTVGGALVGAVVTGQSPPAGSRVVAGMPVSFQVTRP